MITLHAYAGDYQSFSEHTAAALLRLKGCKSKESTQLSYQQFKHARKFKNAGCATGLALLGSRMVWYRENRNSSDAAKLAIVPVTTTGATFDKDKVAAYLSEPPFSDLIGAFRGAADAQANDLNAKLTAFRGRGLRGLVHHVDEGHGMTYDQLQIIIDTSDFFPVKPWGMPDIRLYVNVVREFTARWGQTSHALWGAGAMLFGHNTALMVTVVDIEILVAKSSLLNLDSFADALEHRKVVLERNSFYICELLPGQALHVPFGMAPIVSPTAALESYFYFPWLDVDGAKKTSAEARSLIITNIKQHISGHGRQSLAACVEPWAKFCSEVDTAVADAGTDVA
jgi:hypothetical protein